MVPCLRSHMFMCFRNMALEVPPNIPLTIIYSCHHHSLEFPFPKSLTELSSSFLSVVGSVSKLIQ